MTLSSNPQLIPIFLVSTALERGYSVPVVQGNPQSVQGYNQAQQSSSYHPHAANGFSGLLSHGSGKYTAYDVDDDW